MQRDLLFYEKAFKATYDDLKDVFKLDKETAYTGKSTIRYASRDDKQLYMKLDIDTCEQSSVQMLIELGNIPAQQLAYISYTYDKKKHELEFSCLGVIGGLAQAEHLAILIDDLRGHAIPSSEIVATILHVLD